MLEITDQVGRNQMYPTDTVVVLRTDTVIAAEIRAEMAPLIEKICAVMSKARADGYEVSWAIAPDSFGRHLRCTEIAIKKQL